MFQIAIGSFLLGAALGLRFRVFVMVPATACGAIAIAIVAIALGQRGVNILSEIVSFVLALQVGYLFGSLTRFTVAAARVPHNMPETAPAKALR